MKCVCLITMVLYAAVSGFGIGVEPLPEESGAGGSVTFGASWLKVKSNSLAGPSYKTLTRESNSSLANSPDGESSFAPMFSGQFYYTFEETRTQLFLDGVVFGRLSLDTNQAVGVRQELADESILEGSFLFTASPIEVWTDPFVTGADRNETDRESTGGRIAWGRMFGTGLQLQYSYRDIDIDSETSGVSLPLTAAQRGRLDRNGEHHEFELLYIHPLADNQWIAPQVSFNRFDLDGEAMAFDGYDLALTHIYAAKKFKLITSVSGGFNDYDRSHPVFGKTRDDVTYGVSTTLIWPKLFNRDNVVGTFSVGYWRQNSDIAFYDEEMIAVMAGTTFTF